MAREWGGLGVSGDQSCTDHFIGWRVRHTLGLDNFKCRRRERDDGVVATPDPNRPDNIIYDIKANPNGGTGISASGFGHPPCVNYNANPASLPAVNLNP